MPQTRDEPLDRPRALIGLAALLQNRNFNAYALIAFGGIAFALKMPDTIYGGLILGGLAVLKSAE